MDSHKRRFVKKIQKKGLPQPIKVYTNIDPVYPLLTYVESSLDMIPPLNFPQNISLLTTNG